MLQSMCADDSRLQVCEKEIGTIEPRTMPTLQALQEDNPEAELYFVMGADKFDLLASLAKKRQFLDAFKVVLYSRDGAALEQSIEDDEVLGVIYHADGEHRKIQHDDALKQHRLAAYHVP